MRVTLTSLLVLVTAPASAQFSFRPPGELEASGGGSPRPGAGRVDDRVYAPGMRFPIEEGPAYANSQIYGHGGYMGPGGGQCTTANYAYPWHDNYCEERSWDMPLCPSGTGHQGQDIRPGTCDDDTHWAVAAADGTVTNIGSYSVYVTGDDGTRYDYLHMSNGSLQVSSGQRVTRGQRLGRVSDNFGSNGATTIHLHFNIRQNVSGVGSVYAPTYMSLVRSYEELVGGGMPPVGTTPELKAEFVSTSFPNPVQLGAGLETTGQFVLRNAGTAMWTPGTTVLAATSASPVAGSTWVSPEIAATVPSPVGPGQTATFSVTVRAPMAAGRYVQNLKMLQTGVGWFSDAGGSPDDQLVIVMDVTGGPDVITGCPGGVGATSTCEGNDRVRCVSGVVERVPCANGCIAGGCLVMGADSDGDGIDAMQDCNDANPTIYPGAVEICADGIDQDCNFYDVPCGAGMPPGPVGADAGPSARPEDPGGGCGCRVTPGDRASWAWSAVLGLWLWRRRR